MTGKVAAIDNSFPPNNVGRAIEVMARPIVKYE